MTALEKVSFASIATQYARDVVDRKIVSCRWHYLACKRHLDDLIKAESGHWPYTFNPTITINGKPCLPAERVCKFAERMPHIKGEWAALGQRIKLEPVQVFILASIFGWINVETKKRRFRQADVVIARKNAKSTLAAVIGNYMHVADGEFGAEVYSGATSMDQAYEVFRPAKLMAARAMMTRDSSFVDHFGVSINVSNMSCLHDNSKFEPIIGNPGDGASPSCAIIDEYHEHKTSDQYDTMQTGMGARSQPLMLMITTAGTDISGPCYMHQAELQKVLEGVIENDQRFGIIFTIDEGDDWTSEEALAKANPNLGVSVSAEFLRMQQRDAISDPRKQNVFKTKHLNVWVAAASPWLNLHGLQKSGDSELTLESYDWDGCVVGLDLASKQDIASVVWVLWRDLDDGRHFYAISRNYVPEAALEKPENAHYVAWVHSGYLISTPGNMIALEQIQEEVIESATKVHIREVAKDPWGGHQLGANLAEEGFVVVDIPQQVRYLSEPMKEIDALINAGRFHHDGNPAYVWMLSNVEVKEDRNDNVFPRKARKQNKIDAALATIVAMNRSLAVAPETAPVPDIVIL
jgi:phage terminase large subunit-like protein